MKKFCAITPTRGDRPRFLEHCKMQVQRQTLQPGEHIIVDYKPKSKEIDLVERVRVGMKTARDLGYDFVFFIEDDDYYPDDYFEKMLIDNNDIIGMPFTWYYHLGTKSYIRFDHPGRSSLFCTALRISQFTDFTWPNKDTIYLDLELWKHLAKQEFFIMYPFPIGIKHRTGLCAGNGHNVNFPFTCSDPDYSWLKDNVRPESFKFYTDLILQ